MHIGQQRQLTIGYVSITIGCTPAAMGDKLSDVGRQPLSSDLLVTDVMYQRATAFSSSAQAPQR